MFSCQALRSHIWADKWYLPMCSPIGPLGANLPFMDRASLTALVRPSAHPQLHQPYSKRFVDVNIVTIMVKNRDRFLQHIGEGVNTPWCSKFTCEEVIKDGYMPFLDILVTPEEDGSLKTSVFRKTTHTDLYLQWDSHHTIPSKYSVAGTLYHRASTVCFTPQLLQEEEEHLFKALTRCK